MQRSFRLIVPLEPLSIIGRVAPAHDLNLARPEKLEALRRLDRFRYWHSLEEKRYCLGCGRIIRGEEIHVIAETDDPGSQRLACPTENCPSIPMDWALPPNDGSARVSPHAGEKIPVSRPLPPSRGIRHSLRKMAKRFFRAGRRSSAKGYR